MKSVKISLVDNDYMVRTKTSLSLNDENEKNDVFMAFIRDITDGFVPGETAHLEIEGVRSKPITFEISRAES
jgi:hypothetical protein